MARTAYVTDLRTLQGECTANYLRMTRLLGEIDAGEMREVPLAGRSGRFGTLRLEVIEQAPYTTIVRVKQTGVLDEFVESPRMIVPVSYTHLTLPTTPYV